MGLPGIAYHPGHQLRVTTLGKFQVCRGKNPIPTSGWQRTKSRQLFQLLVTFRDMPLKREQIYEHLWPRINPDRAEDNFKVALSILYRVLEPNHIPRSPSAYIIRRGDLYSLRPEADIWFDVEEFVQLLRYAEKHQSPDDKQSVSALEKAIQLYQGEFLPDARYETWAAVEREHLSVLYLRAADHLCALYLQNHLPEETITLCQQIIAEDNCWERAYRYKMLAYGQMGDHGQVARTYHRCVEILENELGVSPSAETISHYQELTSTH